MPFTPHSFNFRLCWRTSLTSVNNSIWPHTHKTWSRSSPVPPQACRRWIRNFAKHSDLDTRHSMFMEKSPDVNWSRWKEEGENGNGSWNEDENGKDDLEELHEGKGKLAPTSSHLFKLILPLGQLSYPGNQQSQPPRNSNIPLPPPTVFLLHPSQPLSHVSRLVLASLAPATPAISFQSLLRHGKALQWSDSTDVGDFVRDVVKAAEFRIVMTYTEGTSAEDPKRHPEALVIKESETSTKKSFEMEIRVEVPTFAYRTRYMRRKLALIEGRLQKMGVIKRECDHEARRGARRLAVGGFAMLVVYWGAVARLTFWDFGWDVMEPITYLSGLTTVILGYLWFLYQGREVSYSSVLNRSISSRREALYRTRGFDIELWAELLTERRNLSREIGRTAEDYEGQDKRRVDGNGEEESANHQKEGTPNPRIEGFEENEGRNRTEL